MVNSVSEYLDFHQNDWHGKCVQNFLVPAENLTDWLENINANAYLKYRARSIARCETAGSQWFIKTIFGLGENPKAICNLLKWYLRPSRAMHIWRISLKMVTAGIDCPKVLLAARNRRWKPLGWPTDVLITEQAPGMQLVKLLQNKSLDVNARNQITEITARKVASLHRAGFLHGDCQPRNLFVDLANSHVCFIDNDRTRFCPNHPWGRRRNLVQLGYHLMRLSLFTLDDWKHFFDLYAGFLHWDSKKGTNEYQYVMSGIRKRQQRMESHA